MLTRRKLTSIFLTINLIFIGSTSAIAKNRDRGVRIMTYNMYIGAELGDLFSVQTPQELVAEVTEAYTDMLQGNPADRANEIADQMQATAPDLVGLQEVAMWRVGPAFDPAPASTVTVDQLSLLLEALSARGLHYSAIAVQENLDAELPGFVPGVGLQDVRFTDRVVILARTDLRTSQLKVEGTASGNYTINLQVPVLGQPITILRGWAFADVKIRGKSYRFINTHLESYAEPIQLAQAAELLAVLVETNRSVILAGDFNSDAESNGTAYLMLTGAGFLDTWDLLRGSDPGLTWPLSGEIPNTTLPRTQRLDLILTRGQITPDAVDIIGEEPGDMSPSGFWPSDHAGLFAEVVLTP